MIPEKYVVKIETLLYRGKECFVLRYTPHPVIISHLKEIPHIQYSETHNTFYIFQESISLHQLFSELNKKAFYVDYSAIKSHKKPVKNVAKPKQSRIISEDKKQLIREFVKYLYGLRLSESTVMTYFTFVADFVEFIGDKAIANLNNIDVRLFVEQQVQEKQYSISSHRQMISALKHFGVFLPDSNLKVEDFSRPKKSSYLPTVLSIEEAISILRVTRNLKHRIALALLYSAGLRIGEMLNLELRDIDISRRQIIVKNGKGRKDRVVIMAESFIPLFLNYITTYAPKKYFIEGNTGGKYSAGSVRSFLKKSCELAQIKKRVTPHTLRHSYATHLLENGVGIRHIQELLGHSKPETTMIYTHVTKKDLLNIRSPLDTALITLSTKDKDQQKPFLSDDISG